MKKILITGGAGFIGHHICEHILKSSDAEIIIVDKLNYASSGFDRLRDIKVFDTNRVKVFTHDITLPIVEGLAKEIGDVDYILHLAAETHVDNSITNPEPFVMSNVVGTMRMLEYARTLKNLKMFLYFSTDEVFGPAPGTTMYKEWDRYNSGNPYSAAKAAGEELCLAWANTYKLPIIITHCMNVIGERQDVEKYVPKVIKACLNGEKIFIHSNKDKTKAGSRFYIHARNVADAVWFLMKKGYQGTDKYNIVGQKEVDNLELAQMISKVVGKPLNYEMVDFHSSRPGHDLRYGLDGSKMKELGWEPPKSFEESLEKTIRWTLENIKWLK
jgi:dTDP-glucose 4,6-dehydratase